MKFEHIEALKTNEANPDDFLEHKELLKVFKNIVCIDDKVALPIVCSYSFDRSNDIDVHYEKTDSRAGYKIGEIKFLKGINRDYRGLPDTERICFYIDYTEEIIVDNDHTFKYDYLIVNRRNFDNYRRKFKKTSSIWGSFFHIEDKPQIKFDKTNSSTSVSISKNIKINNDIYKDNLFLSINEPNPFNRFLKLYHLLELQFDMHTAIQIKTLVLEENKEKEISSLLRSYNREELSRLYSIIQMNCNDSTSLAKIMNLIHLFPSKARKIFYDHARSSNPLKIKDQFNTILNDDSKFLNQALIESQGHNYSTIIPKLCGFWIYRIRCSIAHNKFGEYIMKKGDEDFIVNFAEPLLKEVVKQCFIYEDIT